MTTLRHSAGTGPCASGRVTALAVRVLEHACARGWQLKRLQCSKVTESCSRYIQFADRNGRPWSVRISNHNRPKRSFEDAPHFDLVSRDGKSGLDQLKALIDRADSGDLEWWSNAGTGAQRPARKRRAKRKYKGSHRQ